MNEGIAPQSREYFLKNRTHNLNTNLILCRGNYGNTLLSIKYGRIGRRVGEEVAEEFCKLRRSEIFLIKRWSLAYSDYRIVEIGPDELSSLTGKFTSGCRCRDDRRRQNQPFQWSEPDTLAEPDYVEMAENIALPLVDGIAEPVSKKWVASQALGFLDEKPES